MDIFGIKYFARSAWGYLRGTAREGRVIGDSVNVIRKNMQHNDDADNYPVTIKTTKNARVAMYTHGVMFFVLIAGTFLCLHRDAMLPAFANFAMSLIFAFLAVRAAYNIPDIDAEIQRRRG